MDEKEFFHQGTIRICGSLDKDKMLESCFNFFKKFFPLEVIAISKHYFESESMEIIGQYSEKKIPKLDKIVKLGKSATDFVKSNKKTVLLVKTIFDDPVALIINTYMNFSEMSGLVLNLKVENEVIGFVAIFCRKNEMFTEDHAKLYSVLHDPFAIAISNILRYRELVSLKDSLKDENTYLHEELRKISGDEIIGSDSGLKDVMEMVRQVSHIDSKVLILGETGVGKEVIASAIHYSSSRKDKPFIKLNCGAIHENLIDSELFGHEKGAFTGAVSVKKGRFERADGGTLFLDEIGELPMNAQTRLLRVLQTGEFERVGGFESIKCDVRIIAATNRSLDELVKKGEFREDLLFRINVFPITIPPLRFRKDDIPELVEYFIDKKRKDLNISRRPKIAASAYSRLKNHDWPGNIRELENCVERELIRVIAGKGDILKFNDFTGTESVEKGGTDEILNSYDFNLTADDLFRIHVLKVLEKTGGRVQGQGGAAQLLGLNPSTLRNRLRKLDIPFGRKSSASKDKK
jgi:transcriptional regulator with GAF, ATPase, and Fis domain